MTMDISPELEAAARTICRHVGTDPDELGPVTRTPAWQWLLKQAAALYPKLLCGEKCTSPRDCRAHGYCLGNF